MWTGAEGLQPLREYGSMSWPEICRSHMSFSLPSPKGNFSFAASMVFEGYSSHGGENATGNDLL